MGITRALIATPAKTSMCVQLWGMAKLWINAELEIIPIYRTSQITPTPNVTPTPVATPTGTAYPGYCGSVEEASGGSTVSGVGVGLPQFMVGVAECYGVAAADIVDLWGFDLTWPGLEVCFAPFSVVYWGFYLLVTRDQSSTLK